MPLDPSFVGRTYPPTAPYQVGREKIREFATAIGATDAAYHDPEAARALGYPDVVAPPTFPIVVTHRRQRGRSSTTPTSAWTTPGWCTATSGSRTPGRSSPATSWSACTVIEEITSRGGHDFVTTRVDITTPAGEPVVSAWAKLVVRGEG